jgi:AcrR family transcriptional regulator
VSKGELTRSRILDNALILASRLGLEGLTLGVLAESLDLSKSGLYAHFRSKEALILAVLEHTKLRHQQHSAPYFEGKPKGVARLRAYVSAWLDWVALPTLPAGCPILGASFELEAVEGPAREFIVNLTHASRARLAALVRDAIETGELHHDLPIDQISFELRGIALSFHLEHRLLRDENARARAETAFEALLLRYTAKPT